MPVRFEILVKDETGEATLPYALVKLTYNTLDGTSKTEQSAQVTADIHGVAVIELDTGGKTIRWKLTCQDTRYFCSVTTIEEGTAVEGSSRHITMHSDSFIAVFDVRFPDRIVASFLRAIDAAQKFGLAGGDVLLFRNHVVNHHEYDTNQIYGGLIGRKVTASYQKLVAPQAKYDQVYTPFVLYRTPEARQRYVLDETTKLAEGLAKNRGLSPEQRQKQVQERTARAQAQMDDLTSLVEPGLAALVQRVDAAYQEGVRGVQALAASLRIAAPDARRQLLQDAQESGAKSPFISTSLVAGSDVREATAAVIQYTVDRYADGINLELMLLAGPRSAGIDFEAEMLSLDSEGTYARFNHRTTAERAKDAELKEFGILDPSLPLDGTPTAAGFRILKRCVLNK